MMFSSSSLDKNCINSDSNTPGRNTSNAPNRFSVGISPLGEENQQIRIQLAVHKYNGTANSPFKNRCSLMSPVKHAFLKNSLKVRNYEGDTEGTSKTEKKIGNQYEGVGAFPTVHLKKTAVRYRPIKPFHDVKIPYPELPVNRFLSHLPEVCQDLKSSPRSVLDVLEDLSGNKIHLKDESENGKPTLRGLGGDYHLNPNAVYKPLFVQKPKLNAVLTRDNTTQTLSPVSMESPSPQRNNSYVRNGTSDPRVELRRKLAKQNNEIFASLSSSISSAFSLKRKIDKVLPSKEDGLLSNGSTKKKTKTLTDHSFECSENGILKPLVTCKANSSDILKLNRKNKPSETNSVSPNKDRLTTIFLDTRNTSPKAQVFQANALTEKKVEKSAEKASNALPEAENKTRNFLENGSAAEKDKNENGQNVISFNFSEKDKNENGQNVISFNFSEKSASCNTDKKEAGQSFVMSKVDTSPKDYVKFTSPALQVSVSASDTPNFNSPKTQCKNISGSNEPFKPTVIGSDLEKKGSNVNEMNHSHAFGNSADKPSFGSFKFGTDGNSTLVHNKSFTDLKSSVSESVSVGSAVVTSSVPQFSFGATSSTVLPALQTSAAQFVGQNAFNVPGKMIFTFGQNTVASQQNSKNMSPEAKPETSTASTTATSTTSEKSQSVAFTFGQKQSMNAVPGDAKQDIMSPISQANQPAVAAAFDTSLNKNSPGATSSSGALFSFGQNSEKSVASAVPAADIEEQRKTFSFTFGQKSDVGANKTQLESRESGGNLFSPEQVAKPISQASNHSNTVSTANTQTSQNFVQTVPPAATFTPQATFSQTPTTFATKFTGNLLSSSSTTKFSQIDATFSPDKPLPFESSKNDFQKTTAQTTTGFLTSTSNTPALSFRVSTTTHDIPTFGVSPTTQSAPTFGASSSAQSVSGFGCTITSQSTPTFETPVSHSAPSGFSIPSTTQSTLTLEVPTAQQSTPSFDSSSAKQSTPSFGTTSTQVTSAFGISSPSAPAFGTCSTTQTTPVFASNTGFGISSSQPGAMFGAPTSTQSTLRFGASQTTQSNTTFGASSGFSTTPSILPSTAFGAPAATSAANFPASQSFDIKPIASLAQAPNIFPQNPVPAFSSAPTFSSTQNDIFAQKPATETPLFGQNKIQVSAFGSTSQPFGAQNKFSFGISTTNVTAFTTSPPITTTAPVFSFGGSTSGNTFAFGSSAAGANSQAPFAFKSPANEPFKFGASTTTVNTTSTTSTTTTVQPAPSATFSFGSQINSNLVIEQKSPFSFGSSRSITSAPAFNFGSAPASSPSPSVFNFGGSTSSASSGSTFNFGAPTPGVHFGQTPSPGAPFAVPGTFNIGSGSSQSRPRASSRPRRRP